MPPLESLPTEELRRFHADIAERHAAFGARGLRFDMTRGKPSPEQLDLSNALLALPGAADFRAADGLDCRNYAGPTTGLPEARALFAPMLGAPPDQVLVGGNASLALMHDALVWALLHGVPGGAGPWLREGPITFLCPSPGYDRHFAITETLGIRMVPVPLTGSGPDMAVVERLVREDPSIKGIWCIPKYSNPTGEIYCGATVERLAAMRAAAPDFRIFWDNAYDVHHLTGMRYAVPSLIERAQHHGRPDRALVFASTSKMSFAGAGLALFAASPANLRWFTRHMGKRTIGEDKLNQLRHVRFLRDWDGVLRLMDAHRRLLAPKFAAVGAVLGEMLDGTGTATWTSPRGGYFISLDVRPGSATRAVALAAKAGIALVPAGRTFPYGKDPADRNIRLAPSFPAIGELRDITQGVALSVLLATTEAILAERGEG